MTVADRTRSICTEPATFQGSEFSKKKKCKKKKYIYIVKKQQLEPYMEQLTGSKLGKEYDKAVYCYLFILLIWRIHYENARLDESQVGIQTARRNSNNLIHEDDTTLMAENEEEVKSLLIKVKCESEKAGLKLNIQKTKIMASSPITSWQIGKQWKQWLTLFFGLQNHCRWWLQPWN